jgi:penicillin V acylase-like amidase (Ntn superfamily)
MATGYTQYNAHDQDTIEFHDTSLSKVYIWRCILFVNTGMSRRDRADRIDNHIITNTINSGGDGMREQLLSAGLSMILLLPSVIYPCTTFCFQVRGDWIFGRNYDWNIEDCMITVNKRGVLKTAFTRDNPATWTSRYGSVTFNQYGREFPLGGMNEAGLVIECMWLEGTEYPHTDARYGLSELQWVQYQLDRHETVDEIILSDGDVRITTQNSVPLHFLVCDCRGQAAVIEFLGGVMTVYTKDDLPVAALTNNTYAYSAAFLNGFDIDETDACFDAADYSLKRFVWAAQGAASWRSDAGIPAVHYAFEILEKTAVEFTMFRIVYDVGTSRIYFMNASNPRVRSVNCNAFDLSCAQPVKILDIAAGEEFDVTSLFVDYTFEANFDLINRAYSGTSFLKAFSEETRKTVAAYPGTTTCLDK